MNINYKKPLSIKEYTKRYKFPDEKSKENGSDNTKISTLICNILKQKDMTGNISFDLSPNKAIENNIYNYEKRKKIWKILKNRNKTSKPTSYLMTPRPKTGGSPSFYTGNNKSGNIKDSYCDSFSGNKKDILQTEVHKKGQVKKCKSITPLMKNQKKVNSNSNNDKNKTYAALYKSKEKHNFFITNYINKSQIYEKKNIPNYSPEKTVRLKTIKNNQKESDDLKARTNVKKKNKKNRIKFTVVTTTNTNSKKEKPHEKISLNQNDYMKKDTDTVNNINTLNNLNTSSVFNKSKFDNLQEKNVELFTIFKNISNNNKPIIKQKQELNKIFKGLISEKKVDIFLKNHNKPAKVIKEKEKEKRNITKDTYTGYVLLKKKLGKIEKETKIDTNNLENTKLILLNMLLELTNQHYDIITKNELSQLKSEINKNKNIINESNKIKNEKTIILNELNELKVENTKNLNVINELKTEKMNILNDLNNAKNENAVKDQKIKEQEEAIQKKEEENLEEKNKFDKLQNEYNTMQSEYNNLKETMNIMEKVNKRIMGEIEKLKEENLKYKKIIEEKVKKNKEIRNSEPKTKKYNERIKNSHKLGGSFNLEKVNPKVKRLSQTYNCKVEKLLKNIDKKNPLEKKIYAEKKKSLQNNNNNIINKLAIPEEKKIKENTEDKEENDSVDSLNNDNDNKNKEEKEKEEQKLNENNQEENEKIIETPIINININNNINSGINSNIDSNRNEQELNKVKDHTNRSISPKRHPKMSVVEPNTDRQQKMSKALNRFKKKMSQVPNVTFLSNTPEKSSSCIKKSDKIADIAKMLEKQIGFGKKEETKETNNIKIVNDEESNFKESKVIEIIKRKPASKKKKKPSVISRFKEEV